MMRSLYRAEDGTLSSDLSLQEISGVLPKAEGLLWLDLPGVPADTCEPILRQTFGFHPLAVNDAIEEAHVPRVDDWGQYLYLVQHAVVYEPQTDRPVRMLELDVFLGPNYLVTYEEHPIDTVERVWEACKRDRRLLERGAGHLLYRLTDEIIAGYMPVIEQIDDTLDEIEDQIFDDPQPSLLERLFALKRALLRLRRTLAPQRETLNKLARGDYAVVDEDRRIFFRDLYDHLVRLYDITESLRDLVSSALDTYLSVVNNRMNDVMKTLTVITTLFMPLSFLSGFFGMNFFQSSLPLAGWTGKTAFGLTLAVMTLLPVGMALWMRKRAWM